MGEYRWRARYVDGTVLEPPASSDAIDRDRVKTFELIAPGGKTIIELVLEPPEQRLVYRARKDFTVGEGITQICHVVGIRQRINGTEYDSVAWLIEGDRIVLTGRYDAAHGLFYPPVFRDNEKPKEKN